MFSDSELIEMIYKYIWSDETLEETCREILSSDNLNQLFEKAFETADCNKSPVKFICDAITHPHKYRTEMIDRCTKDEIYKFCAELLYDEKFFKRRDALIIICDTLFDHINKCRETLINYYDFVFEKDPLLMYDYIMEFTWLYSEENKTKAELFSKIIKSNSAYAKLALINAFSSCSYSFWTKSGFQKYCFLSKLMKCQNIYVRYFAKLERDSMFKKVKANQDINSLILDTAKKGISSQAKNHYDDIYLLSNGRLEFSNMLWEKNADTYEPKEFLAFYNDYLKAKLCF